MKCSEHWEKDKHAEFLKCTTSSNLNTYLKLEKVWRMRLQLLSFVLIQPRTSCLKLTCWLFCCFDELVITSNEVSAKHCQPRFVWFGADWKTPPDLNWTLIGPQWDDSAQETSSPPFTTWKRMRRRPRTRTRPRTTRPRGGSYSLGWKVRSARHRTIRTFHNRVRSTLCQNSGNSARIHQKSKNFRNV